MAEFTIRDVFAMAEKGESNAAAFYKKAARLQFNPQDRDMLRKMAAMEEAHRNTFVALRETMTEPGVAEDPYGDLQMYVSAMVEGHGGEGSRDMAVGLTGTESLDEVLRLALDAEQKAILFYVGLRDLLRLPGDREKIEEIIGEEKKHVVVLHNIRKSRRQGT